MLRSRLIKGAIALTGLLVFGCSKPPVNPPPANHPGTLTLRPYSNYLGLSDVDSAVVTWQTNGLVQLFALAKGNGVCTTPLEGFAAGSGMLTIEIYSRLKFGGQYLSRWVSQRQVTIQPTDPIEIGGPQSFGDTQWKPRVVLQDAAGHMAVVALRPDDAYFFVQQPPRAWRLAVSREYWKTTGGLSRMGGGEWQCFANCTNMEGHIENSQFFSFLPAQIGDRPWNHLEIVVVYEMDRWGGGWALSLTHSF